jgi:hypothetical protein
MKYKMHGWLARIHDFVRGAWRRLPLESLTVATAAGSLIALVHRDPPDGVPDGVIGAWLLRLFLGAVLLTPLCFALTGLRWRGVIGRGVHFATGAVAAAAVLGALALALPDVDDVEVAWFLWPYGLSLLAAFLAPFVAVAVGAGPARLAQFTGFLRRFFEQTTTWGLLWLGSVIALAVIFGSLEELFDLRTERVAIDTGAVLTGVFILTYLHRLLQEEGSGGRARMPELWRRLATTVGAPFVSIMLVILVVYEIVVLARGELPRNLLSPLIIAAGFVGFLCTLVIVSILDEKVGSDTLSPADPHRWARRHSVRLARAFPLVLLALLPMAGWALAMRVDQHGLTPFRVARMMALLCLGVMSVLGSARWLRGRMALTWEVPLCIIAFALATAFGPVSAVRLSLASQIERLERNLAEAGVVQREVAEAPRPVTHAIEHERYWQLQDGIQTVAELGGEAALRRVLGGAVKHCADRWSGRACLERLGVDVRTDNAASAPYQTVDVQQAIPGAAGELVFVDLYRGPTNQPGLHLTLGQGVVEVYDGARKLGESSLAEWIESWRASGVLPPRLLALRAGDVMAGHLAVQRLEIYQTPGQTPGATAEVTRLHGVWIRPASRVEDAGAPGAPDGPSAPLAPLAPGP